MDIEDKGKSSCCREFCNGKTDKQPGERGVVLVVTLLLALVLLVLGATAGNIVFCEKMMSGYYLASEKALMLADSGIEKVRAELSRDPAGLLGRSGFTLTFEQDTVSVTVTAPNGSGFIEAASQAVLNSGAKKKVTAEFSTVPWIGLTARRVMVSGNGPCIVQGNAAVQQVQGTYQQIGNRYSGFAVPRVDVDVFRQLAQASPGSWRVYSGNTVLTAQDFEICRNILVEGNATLNEEIAGCPEGSLLVCSGTVSVFPGQLEGTQDVELSIICAGDLTVTATRDAALVPWGYLHSNTKMVFDAATRDEPLTVYGIIAAGELIINTNDEFIINEERSAVTRNELLRETVLRSMISYQEVPV